MGTVGKGTMEEGTRSTGLKRRRDFHRIQAGEYEQRYRALLDTSPNPVCVHQNGTIVYVNAAALKMAGIRHVQEVIGTSVLQFVRAECHPVIQTRIREMQETGESPPVIEIECCWPNGSRSEVEILSTPVPWHGETAVQFVMRDITERKLWERKLAESEKRFHQLADSMPQIVWMANADGLIDYRNRKFFEVTGLAEAEAENTSCIWPLILHPEDSQKAIDAWNQAVATGTAFEMEYRYKTGSGSFRWHLGRALPVKDDSGKVIRWFGTCTDIHDKKVTELELVKTKESLASAKSTLEKRVNSRTAKLNASIKSMEDFCYSIAHNLRAPVRAMQGFSTALVEDYRAVLDENGVDYITRIHRAAANMDTLILDLLAYGRVDHQELAIHNIHLRDALETIYRRTASEIETAQATVTFDNVDFHISGDDNLLGHIFSNLFSNAVKFSKPGVPAAIEVSAEERDDRIRVFVRDNGIGIEPDLQQRIFYAFERLNPADHYPGTGIGLAIARKAALRLNGQVGVESEAGHGSCFWVDLPKGDAENKKLPTE